MGKVKCLENLVYHFFRQLWLVLGVKLLEINSNWFLFFFRDGLPSSSAKFWSRPEEPSHLPTAPTTWVPPPPLQRQRAFVLPPWSSMEVRFCWTEIPVISVTPRDLWLDWLTCCFNQGVFDWFVCTETCWWLSLLCFDSCFWKKTLFGYESIVIVSHYDIFFANGISPISVETIRCGGFPTVNRDCTLPRSGEIRLSGAR